MSRIRLPATSFESAMLVTLMVATLSMVSSLDRDFPLDSNRHHTRLAPVDTYPRNYYQLYHDMESWKRAPSAGFYGMRGKKAPSSNFYGMRGKKGPSGFLGMRGKKLDTYSQLDSSNEVLSPVDSFEDVWMPPKPQGFIGRPYSGDLGTDDLQAEPSMNHREPQEDRLFSQPKTNLGKINI